MIVALELGKPEKNFMKNEIIEKLIKDLFDDFEAEVATQVWCEIQSAIN